MESPQPSLPPTLPPQPRRGRLSGRLAAVGVTGLMVGAAVVGLGGMASADEPTLNEPADITESIAVVDGEFDGEAFELSPEDEAVFERYDQCLADAGIPVFELDAEIDEAELDAMTDAEWDALEEQWEAAAETCDPILEDLSDEVGFLDGAFEGDFEGEAFEISPEDEAVFERYDQCLTDAGVPIDDFGAVELDIDELEGEEGVIELDEFDEMTEAEWEAFDEAHEQAFETCDPILEDLSDDAMFAVEGCEDYDGEVVEGHIIEDGDDVLEVTPADQA